MNNISAVRIMKFDTGHRVVKHESKCANLHGHEYKLHAYATAKELDSLGRIIDFSVIKQKLGKWLDDNWDHTLVLFKDDPLLPTLLKCEQNKSFYITSFNPTAENMANYILTEIAPKLFVEDPILINKIRLYETTNCYVEVSL